MKNRIGLPYGTEDLDPNVQTSADKSKVRCYLRNCKHYLRPPSRGNPGDVCPAHEIRCHLSAKNATYSYPDVRRNIIASPDIFANMIVGHPFKFESHRLGSENSEDALTAR